MRKLLPILFVSLTVWAQAQILPTDCQALADQDLMGTSRYVGMAGAMVAVGGDPSAANDNPAGLGLYRRNEISLSFDYQRYNQPEIGGPTRRFSCSQASWNFCFLRDHLAGVVANNVAINYRRLKNFNREYSSNWGNMDYSLMDVMVIKTDGLDEKTLQSELAWDNLDIGWLSKLGYEAYLINPTESGSKQWEPAHILSGMANVNCIENGALDEFVFDWGMNISNRFYVGAGVAIRSLSYSKTTTYTEHFSNDDLFKLQSYMRASGIGANASLGMIYRPAAWLRLGAAFHSPTMQALTLRSDANIYSDLQMVDETVKQYTPDYSETLSSFTMPMHSMVGAAFQFKNKGLLSFEYDYQHSLNPDVLDVHWMKMGGEWVIASNWFVNAGYAFKCNRLQSGGVFNYSDPVFEIGYNAVRTETQSFYLKNAHYITAGLAFRHPNVIVGLAYQYRLMTENMRMHELQTASFPVASNTHKLVLTLAFRR